MQFLRKSSQVTNQAASFTTS